MARIAKQMGASVGGLYRYYPHKEAIFVAIQLHALDGLHQYVATTLGDITDADGPEGQKPVRSWARFSASGVASGRVPPFYTMSWPVFPPVQIAVWMTTTQ